MCDRPNTRASTWQTQWEDSPFIWGREEGVKIIERQRGRVKATRTLWAEGAGASGASSQDSPTKQIPWECFLTWYTVGSHFCSMIWGSIQDPLVRCLPLDLPCRFIIWDLLRDEGVNFSKLYSANTEFGKQDYFFKKMTQYIVWVAWQHASWDSESPSPQLDSHVSNIQYCSTTGTWA